MQAGCLPLAQYNFTSLALVMPSLLASMKLQMFIAEVENVFRTMESTTSSNPLCKVILQGNPTNAEELIHRPKQNKPKPIQLTGSWKTAKWPNSIRKRFNHVSNSEDKSHLFILQAFIEHMRLTENHFRQCQINAE